MQALHSIYKHLPFVELRLFEQNSSGLPTLYNLAIVESKHNPAILIFIHDDIHLCDFFWADQIFNALQIFDIVGLVGNKRRVPRQPSWAFIDNKFTWDAPENLSGIIGHGSGFPCLNLTFFGPPCQEVKLLDGLMLICRSEVLIDKKLVFDEQFHFHFYDLDFCRQAEQKKIKMGTWAISAIHESDGNFGSEGWKSEYQKYLEKWGD